MPPKPNNKEIKKQIFQQHCDQLEQEIDKINIQIPQPCNDQEFIKNCLSNEQQEQLIEQNNQKNLCQQHQPVLDNKDPLNKKIQNKKEANIYQKQNQKDSFYNRATGTVEIPGLLGEQSLKQYKFTSLQQSAGKQKERKSKINDINDTKNYQQQLPNFQQNNQKLSPKQIQNIFQNLLPINQEDIDFDKDLDTEKKKKIKKMYTMKMEQKAAKDNSLLLDIDELDKLQFTAKKIKKAKNYIAKNSLKQRKNSQQPEIKQEEGLEELKDDDDDDDDDNNNDDYEKEENQIHNPPVLNIFKSPTTKKTKKSSSISHPQDSITKQFQQMSTNSDSKMEINSDQKQKSNQKIQQQMLQINLLTPPEKRQLPQNYSTISKKEQLTNSNTSTTSNTAITNTVITPQISQQKIQNFQQSFNSSSIVGQDTFQNSQEELKRQIFFNSQGESESFDSAIEQEFLSEESDEDYRKEMQKLISMQNLYQNTIFNKSIQKNKFQSGKNSTRPKKVVQINTYAIHFSLLHDMNYYIPKNICRIKSQSLRSLACKDGKFRALKMHEVRHQKLPAYHHPLLSPKAHESYVKQSEQLRPYFQNVNWQKTNKYLPTRQEFWNIVKTLDPQYAKTQIQIVNTDILERQQKKKQSQFQPSKEFIQNYELNLKWGFEQFLYKNRRKPKQILQFSY